MAPRMARYRAALERPSTGVGALRAEHLRGEAGGFPGADAPRVAYGRVSLAPQQGRDAVTDRPAEEEVRGASSLRRCAFAPGAYHQLSPLRPRTVSEQPTMQVSGASAPGEVLVIGCRAAALIDRTVTKECRATTDGTARILVVPVPVRGAIGRHRRRLAGGEKGGSADQKREQQLSHDDLSFPGTREQDAASIV